MPRKQDSLLERATNESDRLIARFNLQRPDLVAEIRTAFARARSAGLGGKRAETVVAAIVYVVARNNNSPITLRELAKESSCTIRELKVMLQFLYKADIKHAHYNDPDEYIPRYCYELGVDDEILTTAEQIARNYKTIQGNPAVTASAAIYLAARLHSKRITQHDISKVSCVSNMAIRHRYQHIITQPDFRKFDEHNVFYWIDNV